jgi:putative SOS response-associated peptidase YedK
MYEVIFMCGRFTVSYTYEELLQYLNDDFDLFDTAEVQLPRYNVAPSNEVLVITYDGRYHLKKMKWGYVPVFNPSLKLINIRSESVNKYSFKKGFSENRCLVIADGFYEWDQMKNPYYFSSEKRFMFAGIYQDNTVGILTTSSNHMMSDIHGRMPVMIEEEQYKEYLTELFPSHLLVSYEEDGFTKKSVSKRVNSVKNDDVSLIKEEISYTLF